MTVLGLAFFCLAILGRILSGEGGTMVNFWLPGGLLVAVLLINPTRDWPWLMLSAIPANVLFDVLYDPSPRFWVIATFCAANVLQAGLGATCVRRFVANQPVLGSLREFFGLVLFAGALGSAVSATMGASVLVGFGLAPAFGTAWKICFGGNLMAVLVLTPLILVFSDPCQKWSPAVFKWRRVLEGAVILGGLGGYLWYLLVRGAGINSPKAPVLVFVLWAAVRFGLKGGTVAVLCMSLWMAFLTARYLRGLSPAEVASGGYAFTLHFFVAMGALVGLVPAIVLGERDRTLARLRDSEARFRTLTEAAFEGIFISEHGCLVDVNDQGLKLFGRPRGDLLGKNLLEFVVPGSLAAAAASIRLEKDSIIGHELLRGDGSTFFAEARAKFVLSGDRRLRITALRDITDRKQAEHFLRESEEKFSKAFRASPDGMAISELESGRYLEINEGYCHLFGFTEGEMLGHSSVELGLWADLADRDRLVAALKKEGVASNLEARMQGRHGRIMIILISAESIELQGKSCLVSVLHDVTGRILAERALRASEESLRATIENAPHMAVQWFDRQGRVIYWNPASEHLFGWKAADALGRTLDQLIFTADQTAEFLKVIAGLEQNGRPYGPVEYPFRLPSGQVGVMLSTLFQIQNPSGEPCYVCMDMDLTRRKQAEEANRSQRQVLEMIASGQPMNQTLTMLLKMIEFQDPDMLCSVLLLEADGLHLRHGAAPSLPAEYIQAIDGAPIGECVGSCGTAAYRREPVFVADIASDPLWVNYRQLALPHGLRACWSTPIFDGQRRVLGTFAVYYRQPGLPQERHQELIRMATDTAAICLSRHQVEAERLEAVTREQHARIEYTLQLIAAQEAERKRIAGELHDSMGQNLLLIKNLAQMVQQSAIADATREQIATINHLAALCIAEARQISRDLHPYQLDHLGLKRSLEAMLEHAAQASRIQFASKIESVDDLFSGEAAMNLYRIVQESLNNVLKHSHAHTVSIRLERDIHEVLLQVEDDGAGFRVEKAGGKKGLGLKNMSERVRMLGGKLNVVSAPGEGARIEVAIPIRDACPR
jgi:PAS domain S-box-containing protein